jgi:hypothetical protein
VPINTLFGISVALLIARNEFPGKARPHRHLYRHLGRLGFGAGSASELNLGWLCPSRT